jgi:hypothetical protein
MILILVILFTKDAQKILTAEIAGEHEIAGKSSGPLTLISLQQFSASHFDQT